MKQVKLMPKLVKAGTVEVSRPVPVRVRSLEESIREMVNILSDQRLQRMAREAAMVHSCLGNRVSGR